MPTCSHCDATHDVTALVRHEREGVTLVHCPDCNCLLGRYRDPSSRPRSS